MDKHIKTRLYQGLRDQRLKESSLFKFEDELVTESDLFQFLRKIQSTGKPVSVSSTPLQTEKVKDLEDQIKKLTAQLENTSLKDKESNLKRNKTDNFRIATDYNNKHQATDQFLRRDYRHDYDRRNDSKYGYGRRNCYRYDSPQHNQYDRSTCDRRSYDRHPYDYRQYDGPKQDQRYHRQNHWPTQDHGYHRQHFDPSYQKSTANRIQLSKLTQTCANGAPVKNNRSGKKKKKKKADMQKRLIGRTNTEVIRINNKDVNALIDPGSVISSITYEFYNDYLHSIPLRPITDIFPEGVSITSATDHELNISGFVDLKVIFPGLVHPIPILFTVLKSSCLSTLMPALIGSSGLEAWKSKLNDYNISTTINPVIDTWKIESSLACVLKNKEFTTISSGSCSFISTKINIKDIRPYNRTLLFTPFNRYSKTLASSTLTIPKNSSKVLFDVTTLPIDSPHRMIHIVAGKSLGIVSPIQEEVFIHLSNNTTENDFDDKHYFLESFDNSTWPIDKKKYIEDLLWTHKHVFSKSRHDLGRFTESMYNIELTEHTPIKQKYRRIPPHLFQAVKEEIDMLLDTGVIRPSVSPYSSPISIAVKKDGSPRICLDFRKLNNITHKDAKSIPSVDEQIDSLHGKRIFSSIDLMQGYHQQELEEHCKQYTAFNAGPIGFFEYNRLPFGITNASASFLRMMENILREHLSSICLVYIDDVIVQSESEDQHLINLDKV